MWLILHQLIFLAHTAQCANPMLIAPYNGITMNTLTLGSDYNPREEFLNALTHALGVVFAVVVLVLMLIKASQSSIDFSALQITGLVVYGLGMIAMFLSSSIYHAFSHTRAKWVLKRIDHSAIFAMIAGTYTPILLIGLNSPKAHLLFWVLWVVALAGVVFKVFFVHRFAKMSLITYLLMGWASVFVVRDMMASMNHSAMLWIVAGGAFYTIGAVFYALKKIPYTHAIWHVFVLAGAACHAVAIGLYVI